MIKNRVPMEYEVFIHGAMCFSFSGCCLASSWLHGDSGNRGICRQVCRYSFRKIPGISPEKPVYFPKTSGKELHPFSMRDLNGLEFVKELVRIGISALKIEGRLKNAEYVFKTVSAYRDMLDSIREGRPSKGLPEIPFQRETASGYFPGEADYRRLVRQEASGAVGEVFGKALSVSAHEIRIAVQGKFSKGLRLRVQDSKGRNLCVETLLDYTVISEKGRDVLVWKLRKAVNAAGFTPPYTVYSLGRSAPADTLRFLKNQVRKINIDTLKIDVEINPGLLTARAFAEFMKFEFERVYPLATAASINHPLAEDECARIFNQTGEQPFTVSAVSARIGENLFCTLGNLKETRRRFYRDLHVAYLENRTNDSERRKASLTQKLDRIRKRRLAAAPPGAFILGGSPYSPVAVDPAFVAYPVTLEGDIESPPSGKTVLILPHFVPEASVDAWKTRLRDLTGREYTRFIAPTYGWLSLGREFPEAEFIAGPHLYAVNSLAVNFLEQNGVCSFILSPDISPADADSVARFSGRFAALNAPREMFVTRLRVPPGEYVLKGRVFRPRYFKDYTVIEES